EDDRDCLGLDLRTLAPSPRRFDLTLEERDPTGGARTLFNFFAREVDPRLGLWDATRSFPPALIHSLVAAARRAEWPRLLDLSDRQILQACSSTPECEVPWFVETLRRSAVFVRDSESA